MLGYTAAKKGSVNKKTAKKWSKRDKFGRIKKKKQFNYQKVLNLCTSNKLF